jgi:hypothetical protein
MEGFELARQVLYHLSHASSPNAALLSEPFHVNSGNERGDFRIVRYTVNYHKLFSLANYY